MCLYLVGSKFKTIEEVNTLLNRKQLKLTEEDIINMKDNRKEINRQLKITKSIKEIEDLGL